MKKRILGLLTLCLLITPVFSATGAQAADGNFEISTLTTVRGTVRFARRSTVVPYINGMISNALGAMMPFCDGDSCPRSNPYWAVLVDDGTRQYEFHQPFAIGLSRAPNFVELGGVMLRPGIQVAVEGSIEAVSASYGIISDVKSISVLSSRSLPGQANLESIYGVEGTGWDCNSMEGLGNGVDAFVWYGRRTADEDESFHLRVIAKRLLDLIHFQHGVAEIGNVQLRRVAGNVVYRGTVDDTAAVLAIQRTAPLVRNYPSNLTVSSMQGSIGVKMYCNPTVVAPPIVY